MSTGFVLNITQEMLGRLDLADQKIERLAITSENARNRIIASFQQINTQGIDAFINKLNEAQNRIAALGNTKVNIGAGMFSDVGPQAKYAIDEINKVVTSISRIRTATNEAGGAKNPFIDNNLSASIAKLNTEIELAKKNFTELQNRFTHMNQPAGDKTVMTTIQSEAQFLMQYIQLLEQEKKGLIAAKQALDNANKTSQLKDPYKAKIDDLSRESMEAQRYKDSMRAMKEFYTEQDKERKKADKAAENDRKKREKEEKATADRIASYDSKSRRERYKSYTSTYEGAMRTSDKANTLEREIQAVKNLEAARAKLKKTDSDYSQKLNNLNRRILEHNRNIDKATAGSKNLQNQHRSLMDISGQLARRLAMVFSIYQVAGYVKKLIEVRGEFELQQRALQAILQDKDKANEIWQKTVDLAVKSPFRVKELVSYTKQLAAYRIESDKLFETNKMLADISAGLGVDMQRLILAFGQVRSAAYLRGTELRQFTEAGIPILEELAKHFTELEGRAVSVGDVFERISKRMVSFSDVETIFKKMTSEGGTFYRMQEIQAATLKGMWSNLKDSVDLMINSIGKANEDTLKGSIKSVKDLIDNYKDLVDVIKMWLKVLTPVIATTVLARIATSRLGMSIYNMIGSTSLGLRALGGYEQWLVKLTRKSTLLGGAIGFLGKALAGLGIGAAIWGIASLVKALSNAYLKSTELERASKRLKEAWERIFAEDNAELEKSTSAYTDLVVRLREANEGSQDRKNIINRLNNEYGQYLDFVVDETTTLDQLADSYDTVIKRMKEKASLATYEKGVAAIEEEYTTALKYAKEEFYDLFDGASIRLTGDSLSDAFNAIVPTEQDINNIYALLQQKIEELSKEQMDDLAEQQKIIQDIIKGYYGKEYYLSKDYNNAIDLINVLIEKKEKEEELQREIDARYKETLSSRKANLRYQEIENKYTQQKQQILAKDKVDEVLKDIDKELGLVIKDINNLSDFDINKILDALAKQFELNKIKLQFDFDLISEEKYNKERDKIINWANLTTKSINESINTQLGDIFSEEELSRVLITEEKQAKGMASILKDIESEWKSQNEVIAQQISLKSEGLEADEKLLKKAIRMEELYRKVADILGIELKYTERLSEESRNAINAMLPEEFQISLEQAYGGIDAILKGLKDKETEHLNVIEQLNEQKKNGLPIDEERLRLAEEAYWWTKKKQDLLDPKAKTAISESRVNEINAKLEEKYQIDAIDRAKDEVTLLQEANTEKENAIAYEAQLIAMKAAGLNVTKEELQLAKKEAEQYILRWKLLGGTEKNTTRTRTESLMDERIKVVDDMNKAYKDLNKTLSKSESLEGAFAKYKDAFKKAYAGTSLLPKKFGSMTAEQFIKEFNFTTEEGMVGFFDKLIAYAKKTSEKVDVELAKGDYIMETRLTKKKDSDKELLDEIQKFFDKYELSLELKKLNIPSDLAKSLFDVDYIDLEGLKTAIQEQREKFVGTDMEGKYKDFLDKIDDMEDKAAKERMKTYTKYLLKGMSERVKLKIEEMRKLKEIEESKEFTPEQKERIKKGVSEEARKEQQKQEWKDFKESDMYTMMFEDLEHYGTEAINMLYTKLSDLKKSLTELPANEVKEIVQQIEKLENIKIERNPFKELAKYRKEVKNIGFSEEELQGQLRGLQEREAYAQRIIDVIHLMEQAQTDGMSQADALAQLTPEQVRDWQVAVDLQKQLGGEMGDVVKNQENIVKRSKESQVIVKGQISSYKRLSKAQEESFSKIETWLQSVDDLFSSAKELMTALGVESDSVAMTIAETGSSMVSLTLSAVQFTAQLMAMGVAANLALGIIGWIAIALQAVATLITAIFTAKDNQLKRQVEEHQRTVENLMERYEELSDKIDKAWDTESIRQYNSEMQQTMSLAMNAQKAAIAAQEQRKGANKEGSENWEELQDMKDELKDMEEQLAESLEESFSKITDGILDDVHGAAKEFTDAWYEAFKETGDGLSGLEENFTEMFLSLAKNQAAMQITGAFVDEWKRDLKQYLNNTDTRLTPEEARAWADEVKATMPELSAALEAFLGTIHEGLDGGASGLSALTKGIQGMSEQQAEILTAYWNSVRGYTASIDSKMNLVLENLGTGAEDNPMLEQMRLVAKNTSAINTLLSSLVKGGHPQGGQGLKVFMD